MTMAAASRALKSGSFSRVVVIGSSGSGKSTLAVKLAAQLEIPFIATDAIYWQTDWTPVPAADIYAWLDSATHASHWVLDGNFDAQRDILWSRAELAIWLDLPWIVTVSRVIGRNLRWWIGRTPVWGGMRMTFPRALGGIRHAAKSHGLKRRIYPALLRAFPNLTVVHVRSARALKRWEKSAFGEA